MKNIVEFRVNGASPLLVEVVGDTAGLQPAGRGDGLVKQATISLEEALANLEPGVRAVGERFQALKPDSIELEFGLKFTAKAGVVIASGGSEASLKVTCKWRSEKKP